MFLVVDTLYYHSEWRLHRSTLAPSTARFCGNYRIVLYRRHRHCNDESERRSAPHRRAVLFSKLNLANNTCNMPKHKECTRRCLRDTILGCRWMRKRRLDWQHEGSGWICRRSGGRDRRLNGWWSSVNFENWLICSTKGMVRSTCLVRGRYNIKHLMVVW